ncbi:hypothetical protein CsSME_00023297 [Camellia sinensis var. sinensis]
MTIAGNVFYPYSKLILLSLNSFEFSCCLGMICKSLLVHTSQPMTMPMRKDMDEDTPQWCKSIFRVLSVSFFSISLMESKLRSGTTLIVDRYSFSRVAFSSAKGLDFEWCKV